VGSNPTIGSSYIFKFDY